jgi:adenylate cyclase
MGFLSRFFFRREIKKVFGEHISPEEVEKLVCLAKAPALGATEQEITSFFCSANNFTGFSESLSASRLIELMNRYLTTCTEAVLAEGGTLDKYIGDAVIAMFGAPVHQPDHALRACVAVLKVQDAVSRLRDDLRREPGQWPEMLRNLRVRVGLNSGHAIVGNIGTATRFNYTMMGDEVNLAARMEAAVQSYGVWTLCTGATKHACEQARPGRVIFRPLGKVTVKGRANQVELFEPFALAEAMKDEWRECLSLFGRGIASYEANDWDGAIRFFSQSAALERDQPDPAQGIAQNPSTVFSNLAAARKAPAT